MTWLFLEKQLAGMRVAEKRGLERRGWVRGGFPVTRGVRQRFLVGVWMNVGAGVSHREDVGLVMTHHGDATGSRHAEVGNGLTVEAWKELLV